MLRRFFAYYAPWKGLFAVDFGCAVLAGLLELGFPIAVKVFVDDLLPVANGGSCCWRRRGYLSSMPSIPG